MRTTRLRTEFLDAPLGIDLVRPRLSWNVADCERQSAYRITATRAGETVWDSGRVESSTTTLIDWGGAPLSSRDRIVWRVVAWDENGEASEPSSSSFEIGLLDADDWSAEWITGAHGPQLEGRRPVDCFRRSFHVQGPVARARLYITAAGVYEARINGHRVGAFELAPGSTDYRSRLHYQTYDVADLLAEETTIEVLLADGWYRGSLGAFGATEVFGSETMLLAQLEISDENGETVTIGTGEEWEWSDDGPIRFADLQDGEIVDARMAPSYAGRARTASFPVVPTASNSVPVTAHEPFPATLLISPSGARILDFGQNIAGFLEFTARGSAGERISIRLGESLDSSGEFTQSNFQDFRPRRGFDRENTLLTITGRYEEIEGGVEPTPKQEIVFTCSGDEDVYRTRFAVFGFRYALIETGLEIDPDDFRAIAVYSDLEAVGSFSSSNPLLDRYLENTAWSMKGNFLDVPTDCPTRERLGWTGDAQIFYETAAYFADVAPFFGKWMRDVRDGANADGSISAVAPYSGFAMVYDRTGSSAGWADALVLVPYRQWKRYGDRRILEENYPAMRALARRIIAFVGPESAQDEDSDDRYIYSRGVQLGEWLEPVEYRDAVPGRTPHPEVATAYLHYTFKILAEIARELGEDADAELYAEYADGAKRAFAFHFLTPEALDTDRQGDLVRPLALGLAEGESAARARTRLVEALERRSFTVGTGFLSTAFLLPVLVDAERPDIAYRVLENSEAPSWLAQVKAGATTVWEDWEGTLSLNHYSPGAVCQWFFEGIAGIRVVGENRFRIAPIPGGSLEHASGAYRSPYGEVRSEWTRGDGTIRLVASVPANTRAEIIIPGARGTRRGAFLHEVGPGVHVFEWAEREFD